MALGQWGNFRGVALAIKMSVMAMVVHCVEERPLVMRELLTVLYSNAMENFETCFSGTISLPASYIHAPPKGVQHVRFIIHCFRVTT